MKKAFAAVLSVAVGLSLSPAMTTAQGNCPAEVTQAKDMLTKRTASVKPDDIQAPRSLAGARSNESVQAPRGNQDVQAPRGNQSVQAPRGNQDVQAPRGNQDVQAPRSGAGSTTTAQAPRGDMTKAASLVNEAEAACKAGNMKLATDKAKAAIAILK